MKADEAVQLLTESNQTLADIGAGVTKIGTETDKLLTMIGNLQTGDLPPALADQITAIKRQAGVVKDLVKVVDDKVPDELPPPNP